MIKNVFTIIILVALGIMLFMQFRGAESEKENDIRSNDERTGDMQVPFKNEQSEHEAEEQVESESGQAIGERIHASWQSEDEQGRVVTYRSDGTVSDSYANGAVVEQGTFTVYEDIENIPTDVLGERERDERTEAFLREVFDSEEYFYAIESINDERMLLENLSTGERYSFVRIKE